MANINTIKITQLQNIGNALNGNTLLPVVDTSGTAVTEKANVSLIGNFILSEAGNTLEQAALSTLAQTVVNAAQPNITSLGTLTTLSVTGNVNLNQITNLTILGGNNGDYLQTNGNGVLNWSVAPGNAGNGSPGGANSQLQFNNSGTFAGDAALTWDAGNAQLNTVKFAASDATIYGNIAAVNATVTTNLTAANSNLANVVSNTISATGNITANFFIGNGSALTGITAVANGAGPNNSIQYNANGVFAGDSNLTYNASTDTLTTVNLNVSNVQSNVATANYFVGDGSNITNIGNANYANSANTANIANLANLVVVEAVNNNFSYHVVLTTGANDYSLHNDADDNFQYNPADGTLTVTRVDTQFLSAGNIISNLTPFLDNTYSLGSSTHKWKDIYLSNSTIYLGDATLSANGNSIVVDSITVTNGNVGTIGNIANLNLDGSSSNVLYGNGVFAPAGGGGNADLGNLQVTGTTIGIANGASETAIVIGANNSSLTLDTDSGAPVVNLQVQSTDSQYYEESFDYTSGTWVTNGSEGTLTITGYSPSFETFLNSLGQYQSFTITVNGSETTATNGYSYGGGTVTFYTILPPGVDPTNVSNIVFNTVFSNKLLMDPDEGDMGIYIGDFNLEIESQRDIRIRAGDDFNIRANDGFEMRANSDFQITTNYNNAQQSWTFDTSGNLSLPSGGSLYSLPSTPSGAPGNTIVLQPAGPSFITDQKLMVYPTAGDGDHIHMTTGNLYQTELFLGSDNFFVKLSNTGNVVINPNDNISYSATWTFSPDGNLTLANGNSVIYSTPNSSLDPLNPNVSTMTLTPDANYNSQVLVLDPTAPGHIHLRAHSFGNIDDPAANIFLGGEATSFEITYGSNNQALIHSNNYTWTFGNDGTLLLPRDAVGNTDPYLWITGGNAPSISSVDVSLAGPANFQIVSDYLNLSGYTGAKVAIKADNGEIATDANMVLTTNNANVGNTYSWTFGTDGSLTLPGDLVAVSASPAPVISGFSSVSALQFTNGNSNVTINANSNTWTFDSTGNLILPGTPGRYIKGPAGGYAGLAVVDDGTDLPAQLVSINSNSGTGTTAISAYANSALIQANINGDIKSWNFDNTGNLTLPGNTFAINYANGTQASAPLVDVLNTNGLTTVFYPTFVENRTDGQIVRADVDLSYRSDTNTLTVGNVVANNFSGNISITGNVTGTSPNVSLVAGSYTYTFDNTGVATFPAGGGNEGGEIQLTQAPNSTLGGNTVTIDNYIDQIRFFEGGGTNRGAYIDLTQAAAGVGTLLNNRVSGVVNAGTFVTMDNIKATVTSSAPRGLSLATVSGTFSYNIGGTFGGASVGSGGSSASGTLTTTPTASIFSWGFTTSGDLATYVLTDTTNSRCYRITLQIGASFNNNSIIIERLI